MDRQEKVPWDRLGLLDRGELEAATGHRLAERNVLVTPGDTHEGELAGGGW